MDSSAHDAHLKIGTKLDVPSWLVKAIYNEKFKFVKIEIPKWYTKFHHEIINADPTVVNLKKMGPYYYDFGLLIANLIDDESMGRSIAHALLLCYKQRFLSIMNLSNQTDHKDLYNSLSRFDATESEIYKAGQADTIGFLRWQRREFCKLLPSIIVSANKNKRKRTDSDAENQPN